MVLTLFSALLLVALATFGITAGLSAVPTSLRGLAIVVVLLVGLGGLLAAGAVEFVGDALRDAGSDHGTRVLRDLRVSDLVAVPPLLALGSLAAALGALRAVRPR